MSLNFPKVFLAVVLLTCVNAADANILVSLRNVPGGTAGERVVLLSDTGAVLSNDFVNPAYLSSPTGLAYGPDGKLYISNSVSEEIIRFAGDAPTNSAPETVLNNSSPAILAQPSAALVQPTAIRFDAAGNLFIANSGAYAQSGFLEGTSVTRFDGTAATTFGTGHQGPVQLYIDRYDNVFVSEFSDFVTHVRAFQPNGDEITLSPEINLGGIDSGAFGTTGIAGNFAIDTNNGNAESGTLYITSTYGDLLASYDGDSLALETALMDSSFPGTIYQLDSENLILGLTVAPYLFKYNTSTNSLVPFADLSAFGPLAIGDIIFTTAVPEPSVGILALSGVAILFARRRRLR